MSGSSIEDWSSGHHIGSDVGGKDGEDNACREDRVAAGAGAASE